MEQLSILGIISLVVSGIGLQHLVNWIVRCAYKEKDSPEQMLLCFLALASGVMAGFAFYYSVVFYIDVFNVSQPSFVALIGIVGMFVLGMVFQHMANWFFRKGFKDDVVMIFLAVICVVISIAITYQPFNLILQ